MMQKWLGFTVLVAVGAVMGCSKSAESPREQDATGGESANGNSQRVTVYMFSEYIAPELPEAFEKLTGSKVKIDVYEATEEMMAKLQNAGGVSSYDVVVVSDHAVPTLAQIGLLQPLATEKIPNLKNVATKFKNPPYDPENKFSAPYQWGTMGIMYNKKKWNVNEADQSWNCFFDATRTPGPFLLIDSMRDMMAAALKFQGASINSRDASAVRTAGEAILASKKNDKCLGFEGGVGGKNRVVSGDAVAAIVYNGDAVRAMDEAPDAGFFIPKEGTLIWVDTMTIPAKAPNPEGAHAFINFILDAKNGAQLSDFNRYATPNEASLALVNAADRANPAIYPTDEQISKMEFLQDLGNDTRVYDEVWTSVKSR